MTTPPPRRRARALALVAALAAILLAGAAPVAQAEEIPLAPGHRLVAPYEGAPATARPVPGEGPAQHPYLAPDGRSGMHADGAGSGTWLWRQDFRTTAHTAESAGSSGPRALRPARRAVRLQWAGPLSGIANSCGEGQRGMSVVESWSRVMDLLREHAPADHADLPGPASERMLADAEERMGVSLPQDLRAWLLQNNLDLPEDEVDDDVACCGYDGFPDEGSFFLGIRAMEKLYANHPLSGGDEWREEWIPFLSDQDAWTGKFIDATDGRVGRWFVGEPTITGEYASLAHYFDSVAEILTRIGAGDHPVCSVVDGRLVWS